jgi:hypothetical protein
VWNCCVRPVVVNNRDKEAPMLWPEDSEFLNSVCVISLFIRDGSQESKRVPIISNWILSWNSSKPVRKIYSRLEQSREGIKKARMIIKFLLHRQHSPCYKLKPLILWHALVNNISYNMVNYLWVRKNIWFLPCHSLICFRRQHQLASLLPLIIMWAGIRSEGSSDDTREDWFCPVPSSPFFCDQSWLHVAAQALTETD